MANSINNSTLFSLTNPNSFEKFRSLVATGGFEPARSTFYSVVINRPQIFTKIGNLIDNTDKSYWEEAVNFFADEVTIPSRQITTGELKAHGNMHRYATGTTYSEISISFIGTKNMYLRTVFERWMNYTSNDAQNSALFYDETVSPSIIITKWEMGSDVAAVNTDPVTKKQSEYRMNKITGIWQLVNAFPFNLGSISLSNAEQNLIKTDVSFYYERYRFDDTMQRAWQGKNKLKVDNSGFDNIANLLGLNAKIYGL